VQIPWGHNLMIIAKCKKRDEALFYLQKTMQNNWSRSVLTHQIESNLFNREGKAITNFQATLPSPHSDLAQQTLKDPYTFDFLILREAPACQVRSFQLTAFPVMLSNFLPVNNSDQAPRLFPGTLDFFLQAAIQCKCRPEVSLASKTTHYYGNR
jgi:hypothetical protein